MGAIALTFALRVATKITILMAIVTWFAPFAYVVITSLLHPIPGGAPNVNSYLSFENFFELFGEHGYLKAVFNSALFSLTVIALAALALFSFGWFFIVQNVSLSQAFLPLISLKAIPASAYLVSVLYLRDFAPILETHLMSSLLVLLVLLPIPTLFFISALENSRKNIVSGNLRDMIATDKITEYQAYTLVYFPICRPMFVVCILMVFGLAWSELLFSSVLRFEEDRRTIPTLLLSLETSQQFRWGPLFAALTLNFVVLGVTLIASHLTISGRSGTLVNAKGRRN